MFKGAGPVGGFIVLVLLVVCVAAFLVAAAPEGSTEEIKAEMGTVGAGLGALVMASMLAFLWLLLPKIVFEVLLRL